MSISKSRTVSALIASTVCAATGAHAELQQEDGFTTMLSFKHNQKQGFSIDHTGNAGDVTEADMTIAERRDAWLHAEGVEERHISRLLQDPPTLRDGNYRDDGDNFEKNHRIKEVDYNKRFKNKLVKDEKTGEGIQKYCEYHMCYMNDFIVDPWVKQFKKADSNARPLHDNSVRDLCNNGYCALLSECVSEGTDTAGDWAKLRHCAEQEVDTMSFEELKAFANENKPEAVQPKKPLSQAAQEMEGKVMSEFFEPVEWDDIKGLEKTKQELINTFELQYQAPQLFDQNSNLRKLKSILLYGPPGTGKTMMAKAVRTHAAKNSGAKKIAFLSVTSSAILDKWVGSSGQNVAALFELARYHQPSVIFFDEFDALAPSRESTGNDGGAMMQVITELLAQMQGANNVKDESVLIIGATNRPAALDSAIMSRMEKHVYVPLPDKRVRKDIILNYLNKETQPYDLSPKFINELSGTWTNHFSARELDQLVAAVTKERSTDLHKAQGFIKVSPHPLYTKEGKFEDEQPVKTKKRFGGMPTYAIYPIIDFGRDRTGAQFVKKPSSVSSEDLRKVALSNTAYKAQLTPKERFLYEKMPTTGTTMKKTYKQLLAQVQELNKSGSEKKKKMAAEVMKGLTLQKVQERHFWAVRNEVTPQVTAAQIAELEEYNQQKQAGGAGHAEPAITPEVKMHLDTVMQIYMQAGSEGVKMYMEKIRKLAENESALCSKQTFAAVLFHARKALRPDLDDVEDFVFEEDDSEEAEVEEEASDNSDSDDDDDGPNVKSGLSNVKSASVTSQVVGHVDQIMRGARKVQSAENLTTKTVAPKKSESMNVNVAVEEVNEDSLASLKAEMEEWKAQVLAHAEANGSSANTSVSANKSFCSRLFCNKC